MSELIPERHVFVYHVSIRTTCRQRPQARSDHLQGSTIKFRVLHQKTTTFERILGSRAPFAAAGRDESSPQPGVQTRCAGPRLGLYVSHFRPAESVVQAAGNFTPFSLTRSRPLANEL